MRESVLVVGLGNPGKKYVYTRHNMGFLVLEALAKKYICDLRQKSMFSSLMGSFSLDGQQVILLLPQTFMNLSGQAVRKCKDYYQIETSKIIVVADDINLPFGKFRFREKGSCGGHNGLRDIGSHLGSDIYSRLRVGVGAPEGSDNLSDYVLGQFTSREKKELTHIEDSAIGLVEKWVKGGSSLLLNALSKPSATQDQTSKEIES